MNVLETSRLLMRPLAPGDEQFVFELFNEPAWLEFIGDRGIRTSADATRYLLDGPIRMRARYGFALDAVVRKEDGELVGICGLLRRETLDDVDLGFAYLQRYWGNGYAREAAAAALAHASTAFKLTRIVALTAPHNARSIKLLESLGFAYERMVRLKADGPPSKLFGYSSEALR